MTDVDVVVVGAGVAGLFAARRLVAGGARVLVLEARDRVGGRTHSRRIGRGTFDVGGQWLGPTQHRLERLADELQLGRFPQYDAGRKLMETEGRIRSYDGSIPSFSLPNLAMIQAMLLALDAGARRVSKASPWASPRLDRQTLADVQRRVPGAVTRDALAVATRVVFGAEPDELSLLHFLFYVHSGGGLRRLVEIRDGAQAARFVDGAQSVSSRMAAKLPVELSTPVSDVEQDAAGVTVRSGARSWRAQRAIVAVPPALTAHVRFAPDLPAARAEIARRWKPGATTKILATYERAFWRDAGLSAEALSPTGPVTVTFDATSHDGAQPALVAFVVGRAARELAVRPAESRRQAVLGQLSRFFGPGALEPSDYVETDWQVEPWSGGCPTSNPGPGGWTSAGHALRTPFGRVHWAGTETATEWCGYIEGALESGERAAAEVAATL